MSAFNLKGMGNIGVIFDIPETEVPGNGYTSCNNVRFRGGSLVRAGIDRELPASLAAVAGVPLKLQRSRVGDITNEANYIATATGYFYETNGHTVTDVTPTGHVSAVLNEDYTSDSLGLRAYFARPLRQVFGYDEASSEFTNVMAGSTWEDSWWRVVRGWSSRLWVANGSDASDEWSQRVMWSDPVENEALATGWDTASLETTSGWVDLTDFAGQILDLRPMGENLYAYGAEGISRIWATSGELLYGNEPVLSSNGVLSTNCVAEVSQVGHFVVGRDTIYLFDGHQTRDIAVDRVEKYFRQTLAPGLEDKTFVTVDYFRSEVWINYVSTAADCTWPTAQYPNRALVWDWVHNAWSLHDVPNVSDWSHMNFYPDAKTWEDTETEGIGWDIIGGTWAMSAGKSYDYPIGISVEHTDGDPFEGHALVAHDEFGDGSGVLEAPRASTSCYAERIAFAVLGTARTKGLALWTTKYMDQISPINDVVPGEEITISVGSSQVPTQAYSWEELPPFDGAVDSWLNCRVIGRYLAWRIEALGTNQLNLPRMDVRIVELAKR